ncbi:MAG: ABC transporter substrate-binding protein [Spirulina sp.]
MTDKTYSRRFFWQLCSGFGFAVAIAACQANNGNSSRSDRLLKVGLNIGNTPWEFENETGELVGFEVELITAIANALGREIEFIDMPFIDLFPALLSERIDVAISSITITEERMKTFDFAQPYYDSDQSLTVKTDSGIAGLKDMSGKVVAVDNASTGDRWSQDRQAQYKFSKILRYEGIEPAMQDLEAGVFDGYIADLPGTLSYTKDRDTLTVVERIPTGERYSMMFAKGNPLRDECNAIISTLKQEGTLAKIYETWFGKAPDPETSTAIVQPVPSL